LNFIIIWKKGVSVRPLRMPWPVPWMPASPLCWHCLKALCPSSPYWTRWEISVVDDEVIRDVHARFLNDPTVTDVITFPHGNGMGEIIVSYDTAIRQASEFNEPVFRELFRYMVHGLLHLHGYIDTEPEERERMFSRQEPLVREFGTVLAGISFPDNC